MENWQKMLTALFVGFLLITLLSLLSQCYEDLTTPLVAGPQEALAAHGCPYQSPQVCLGSHVVPSLQIWSFQNLATEQVLALDNQHRGALRAHSEGTAGTLIWGSAHSATIKSGGGQAVGSFHYGELQTNQPGIAWGGNMIGATYSPMGSAVGLEVNAVNRSGSGLLPTYGLNVVMYGDSTTGAAIVMETANTDPAAKPLYGMVLGGPQTTGAAHLGASSVGILLDRVDTGAAIRLQAGERIELDNTGRAALRYNATTDRIELLRGGQVVGQF